MSKFIHVFIPAINRKILLIETIDSIAAQIQDFKAQQIELVITVLGISNDGSKETVRYKYGDLINFSDYRDNGIYDALYQVLPNCKKGYVTWLGAGDKWMPGSAANVSKLIKNRHKWFTGRSVILDKRGEVIKIAPPRKYCSAMIYEGWHNGYLPLIQQESTFWHYSLHKFIDWDYFRGLKLAGDYYLWKSFSKHQGIYAANCLIGSYRIHDNSLSSDFEQYKSEIRSFTKKTFFGYIHSHVHKFGILKQKILN